jgi:formamidopyrimidine-DNA glycosylase
LERRKIPIKNALLDQGVVSGLGNIYVCEALYRAKISPLRPASAINNAQARTLVHAIKAVLESAIAAGGSTLKDYQHTDGSLGYFQYGFDVYDREGEKCLNPSCGKKIKRVIQSGRSTFYCPACQK